MKTILLSILIFASTIILYSQDEFHFCAQHILHQNKVTDSLYAYKHNEFETILYNYTLNNIGRPKSIITIPVVFHIVHEGGAENVSDARILSCLDDMNQGFANSGYYNAAFGVNTEIQFCLAKQTPDSQFTTGINRISSPHTRVVMETDTLLKNLISWDTRKYLNIWVVKEVSSMSMGPTVVGYATLPGAHGLPTDGIVAEYLVVGASQELSKVMLHEAGHYLGLYHTFQGGCPNADCLLNGDRVCDTPPDNTTADIPCTDSVNSCTTDPDDISVNNPFRPIMSGGIGDQFDIKTNYMDYGNINCATAFTAGQSVRMNAALNTERLSLQSSRGCVTLCTNPTFARFNRTDTTLLAGTNQPFTNTSTASTDYYWTVNGVFFSNATNPSYTFTSSGDFVVCLRAGNGDTTCYSYYYDTIRIVCSFSISATASSTQSAPGSNITFTSIVSGGSASIQWYIDGVVVGTGTILNHVFNDVGGYSVYAIASDGSCYDTTEYIFVSIGTCANNRLNERWYFGNRAGLSFAGGTPTTFNGNPTNTFEGSASLCNENGRVIMYTGTNCVMDSSNVPMPNSAGMLASINNSATQGYLFVKKPGSDTLYYVFTVDEGENDGANGMRYHEININLRSGKGDMTAVKNVLLFAPTTEKLFAIKHCNGRKMWVLGHEWLSDRFRAYRVDENGVDTNAVISRVGSMHNSFTQNTHGQLVASPDGTRLALACQAGFIEIFDFNNTTGVINNPIRLDVPLAYGIAFSPNGKLLYANGIILSTPEVFQFDLTAGSTASAIDATRTIVGIAPGGTHGSLQLMNDGKIYHTNGYELALCVINSPNIAGMGCNYTVNSLALNTGAQGRLGLNNIPVTFSSNIKPALLGTDTLCTFTQATYDVVACTDSSFFSIAGPAQIVSSTQTSVTVSGIDTGRCYLYVKLKSQCGVNFDTLSFYVLGGLPKVLVRDTTLCSSSITLSSGLGAVNYLWNTGATSEQINITTPGTYWVRRTAPTGCLIFDTVVVKPDTILTLNIGNDTIMCPGSPLHINAGNGFKSYRWQDGLDLPTYSVYLPGLYYVQTKDNCNRIYTDSILIQYYSPLGGILPSDTCVDKGVSYCVQADSIFRRVWYNLDTTNQICITINDSTMIWVKGFDKFGCAVGDSMYVCAKEKESEEPVFPSAFTPNNDGLNDLFHMINLQAYTVVDFTIWNRWGNEVFNAKNSNDSWNGKINQAVQPIGTYVYNCICTNNSNGKSYHITGSVSLLR